MSLNDWTKEYNFDGVSFCDWFDNSNHNVIDGMSVMEYDLMISLWNIVW